MDTTAQARKPLKERIWKTLLPSIISLGLVVFVITQLNLKTLGNTLRQASLPWLGVGFVLYVFTHVLRTLRIRHLLRPCPTNFLQLFSVVSLYGMFVYLLPARSGEASLPTLLKTRSGVDLSKGTAILLVARLYDFMAVAMFLPLILVTLWDRLPTEVIYSSAAFLAVVLMVTLGYFAWLRNRPPNECRDEHPSASHTLHGLIQWMKRSLDCLSQSARMKGQGWTLLLSAAIWPCLYLVFFVLAGSLDYWLEFPQIVMIAALMVPLSLTPLQGVANLGSYEAAWVIGFAIFGYSSKNALIVATGSHAIVLIFVLLTGGIGWIVGHVTRVRR